MEIKKVLNPNSISMKLMISSLFVEPGLYFNVSSNVRELISKEISPLLTQSILFTKECGVNKLSEFGEAIFSSGKAREGSLAPQANTTLSL
jgi:hypothetical protein